MHQSSHQTFLVNLAREYILPATKKMDIVTMTQVQVYTSPALLRSLPRGGGKDGILGPETVVMVG